MNQTQSEIATKAYEKRKRLERVKKMKYIGNRQTCISVRVIASNVRWNRINQRMRPIMQSPDSIITQANRL